MFQDFNAKGSPEHGAGRLAKLRALLERDGMAGFVVPLADAHQGEYVADCDARLAWLTGFTGSAGFAAVLADEAGVFIDGRYRVQVRHQVDLEHFTPVDWPATQLAPWLRGRLTEGRFGFDPWLHTVRDIEALRKGLAGSDIALMPTENLVDAVWEDRPAPPASPVRIHSVEHAGQSHADKRAALAGDLRKAGHGATVMTLTDSICWLLNIRGSDIPRNPIVQAFAVLMADGTVDLFIDAPISDEVADHLGSDVRCHPKAAFAGHLRGLNGAVRIDPTSCPEAVRTLLNTPVLGPDPAVLPKACKNEVEIAGARDAHIRDGAAVVRFLHWLDTTLPGTEVTEISAAERLEEFRRATNQLQEISFDTISSTGPNGAINHYRVTHDSNRTLTEGELFLIDSGGQYLDGTTDITRTVPVGQPSARHITCYTHVLQGVIAIHRARFPRGVAGAHLDALARAPLWSVGLDFDHGTGHGVGSYLCVHEGPQRLSGVSDIPLAPGMILSNEPGYYVEGDFGIRLENLITVREAPALPGQDDRDWLDFENLTFVPFDRRLIDADLLTAAERDWLNAYHAEVADKIGPLLEEPDQRDWLAAACAPL